MQTKIGGGPEVSARHCFNEGEPVLADDVSLLGELPAPGFDEPQYLIRRGDQFIQVSGLIYSIVGALRDGGSSADVAVRVSNSTRWEIDEAVARQVIEEKLAPLGLTKNGFEAAAPAERRLSPLGVNLRLKVLGPRFIEPVTRLLQHLFLPAVLIPLIVASAIAHIWLYTEHGLGAALRGAVLDPFLLLAVVGLVLAAAVVHEFGHASALRYGGGAARSMGIGMFTIYPVFYTDSTDAYRLSRAARVRTDLGGIYFHLLSALAVVGLYQATGAEFVLLAVALIDVDIVRQFIPFARLDGYWFMTDVTGIPDVMTHVRPYVRGLIRRRRHRLPFKPWVKVAFVVYAVVGIPTLILLSILFALRLPGFVVRLAESALIQFETVRAGVAASDAGLVAIGSLQLIIVTTMLVGTAYFVFVLLRQAVRRTVAHVTG